jgi:hypothetical protein
LLKIYFKINSKSAKLNKIIFFLNSKNMS